jgi:hypothetical protein
MDVESVTMVREQSVVQLIAELAQSMWALKIVQDA